MLSLLPIAAIAVALSFILLATWIYSRKNRDRKASVAPARNFSTLTPEEYIGILTQHNGTGLQKDELWKAYALRWVQWSGTIAFKDTRGITVLVGGEGNAGVKALIDASAVSREEMLRLTTGKEVAFEVQLPEESPSQKSGGLDVYLHDARLLRACL